VFDTVQTNKLNYTKFNFKVLALLSKLAKYHHHPPPFSWWRWVSRFFPGFIPILVLVKWYGYTV